MLSPGRINQWIPVSGIPDSITEKYGVPMVYMRPFGVFHEDLDVDFGGEVRPYLITQLLQYCCRDERGEELEQNFFWDLSVGKRIELIVAAATQGGTAKLSIPLVCLNEDCQEQMEIELSLEEITRCQEQSDKKEHTTIGGEAQDLILRRPTGKDQREWLKASFLDEEKAIKTMVQMLCIRDKNASSARDVPLSDEFLEAANEAMDALDPLINLKILARCPQCAEENHVAVDLEALALNELYKAQIYLFRDVNMIARHYHWSEEEILAIPPWRRIQYLRMLEKEGNP